MNDKCVIPSCDREGMYRLKKNREMKVCGMHAYVNPDGNDGVELNNE